MIKNCFKIAFRHLWKNKLITGINIFGLSIGISAMLVIFLMIQHDYRFDKHIPQGDRVYRVVSTGAFRSPAVFVPLIRAMESDLPGFEAVAPLLHLNQFNGKVRITGQDDKLFKIDNRVVFTNSQFFDIIPHQWLAGNKGALNIPHQSVLTESQAEVYFPKLSPEEVVGKTITLVDSVLFTVSGVIADTKENTDFDYSLFLSSSTIPTGNALKDYYGWDAWNMLNDSYRCLVKLSPETRKEVMVASINAVMNKHKVKNNVAESENDKFGLQELADVHFNTEFNYEAADKSTLFNLGLLAVFLLLLGAINFINLSTAQSIERAKEIGVRKSLGSGKKLLIIQFLSETFVLTAFATILSVLIAPLLFHTFEGFLPKGLEYNDIFQGHIIGFLVLIVVVVTVLAGFYPAWIMTGFQPVVALKNQTNKNSNMSRSTWVRRGLTVSQFVIAQVFLIAVIVIGKQIRFALEKDMGFNKDSVFTFIIPDAFSDKPSDKRLVLYDKLKEIPEIRSVSLGNQSPAFRGRMSTQMSFDKEGSEEKFSFDSRNGDEHYLDVYGIPLVAGRNIRMLDTLREALINQAMVGFLGFQNPEDVIGKTFEKGQTTIVGVMKDFNISSVREPIRPTMYWGQMGRGYVMHVGLHGQQVESWKRAVEKAEAAFNSLYPDDDFDYSFLNKTVESFYNKDIQLSKLLSWALGLSIFIACLGLFGLAIFTANQRTKEIGIRKVLGASVKQIVVLLIKNLVALVFLACVIAFPIAWYFTHQWLEDFAYKTELSWWIFGISLVGMVIVASLVLSAKAIQAANANPVDSLRDE